LSDDLVIVNKTAMYQFMQSCGEEARPITEALLRRGSDVFNISTAGLTFNWIRCGTWANGLGSSGVLVRRPEVELRPEAQQEFYNQTWYDDQQWLFDKYLEENLAANLSVSVEDWNLTALAARVKAFQDSVENATGGTKCFLNGPGSGEFCPSPFFVFRFLCFTFLSHSCIHSDYPSLVLVHSHDNDWVR
jgi:hypothetical protein